MSIRKCPHCKSNRGYELTTWLGGYQVDKCTFQGLIIDSERHGADNKDNYVSCLNCGKSIPAENIKQINN